MNPILLQARKRFTRIFLQGLIVVLPLAITVALLYWFVATAEDFMRRLVQVFLPEWFYLPGLGTLVGVAVIFAAGLLMNAWIAQALLARAEAVMSRIPIVKSIYGGLRDLASFLSRKRSNKRFDQVVVVSFNEHSRLIGFVTTRNVTQLPPLGDGSTDEIIGVYLPMSYQIGGYTVYVPRSTVQPVAMTVEDAMRYALTAGMSGNAKSPAAEGADVKPL